MPLKRASVNPEVKRRFLDEHFQCPVCGSEDFTEYPLNTVECDDCLTDIKIGIDDEETILHVKVDGSERWHKIGAKQAHENVKRPIPGDKKATAIFEIEDDGFSLHRPWLAQGTTGTEGEVEDEDGDEVEDKEWDPINSETAQVNSNTDKDAVEVSQ